MATIKSFTDIEQSKKLAEILPLESADMYYSDVPVREWIDKTDISKGTHVVFKSKIFAIENLRNHEIGEGDVYAWSLAALLSVLPEGTRLLKSATDDTYHCDCPKENIDKWFDNPVDACVAMIEKLNELNLL